MFNYVNVNINYTYIIEDTYWKEDDDSLQVADTIFCKPFVEKPVSAEDHNVRIYYPSVDGGGSQQLFRKVMGIALLKFIWFLLLFFTGMDKEACNTLYAIFKVMAMNIL